MGASAGSIFINDAGPLAGHSGEGYTEDKRSGNRMGSQTAALRPPEPQEELLDQRYFEGAH